MPKFALKQSFDWDNLGADWTFSYKPNLIDKPYNGEPLLNCMSTEVEITGTILPMVLTCQADIDSLRSWFATGTRAVICPVFNRVPLTTEGRTSQIDSGGQITWVGTNYQFTSFFAYGANSNAQGRFINNTTPGFFRLVISPVARGFSYTQAKPGLPMQVDAIDFKVVKNLANSNIVLNN